MPLHLQRQIDKLKKMILQLGAMVEESFQNSVAAVKTADADLAEKVIAGDDQIDDMEIEIEEECLHTLALHQPVAYDLRFVIAVLKINSDLERIADLAVNVAEMAILLGGKHRIDWAVDIDSMTEKVQSMVKRALDALVNLDADMAESVRITDDEVDDLHRATYGEVERRMKADSSHVYELVNCLTISRHLERIADHATNIAEDVLYMVRGEIQRHRTPH